MIRCFYHKAETVTFYYYYYYYYHHHHHHQISHFSAIAGKHSPVLGYVINRKRLGGLICNFESFLQLNMFQELQIFFFVCTYSDPGCLFRLCDIDFGITAVDDITDGITWAVFCFHIAHISFASSWYLLLLLVVLVVVVVVVVVITVIELSLGASNPYTSKDKTNNNKYT
jgi:hypothetical protein